ncbi:succinyl-CoA:3-ketoacid-coenzyme A transferase-like protein [Xylariomycetidae sp. FL0641]|nr:succinyl-CoA:3-ketoacid-coenzyme A transferase-like protein [Xylariomycetidae sp. FL0641]
MARHGSIFLRASAQFSYRWATPAPRPRAFIRVTTLHARFYSIDKPAPAPAPARPRGDSKVFGSADEALADVQDGAVVLSAGFGLCGVPQTLIEALHAKGVKELTAVSNNAGAGDQGLALLTRDGRLSRIILSYLGANKALEQQYLTGQIAVELCPQGTLAERLRAAGAGIPAFYTATGGKTFVETGEIPARFTPTGVLEPGRGREARVFGGRSYLLETALGGDVALLRAWKADAAGNCVFRYTTKTYAGLMAKAARLAVVEAEHIVPVGALHPDAVDLPGIFVDRVVPATAPKAVENLKVAAAPPKEEEEEEEGGKGGGGGGGLDSRNRIARRAARELQDGYYVNLGVGIPTLAASHLPAGRRVWLQSENGILGMGPYPASAAAADPDLVNAGKETVTLLPGASTFDSAESFAMIRGGHVDVSILGAFQVSAAGDLANYMIPGKVFKGMGGAMDLVSNPDQTKIVVATEHVDKKGRSKIVQDCKLPLTGKGVVSTIITDLCVFQVDREADGGGGLTLTEVAEGVDVDTVRKHTDADFQVADKLGRF